MIINKKNTDLGLNLISYNISNDTQDSFLSIPNQSFYAFPSYFDMFLTYKHYDLFILGIMPISNRNNYFDNILKNTNAIDFKPFHPNTCNFLSDEDIYIGKNARILLNNDVFISSNNYRAKIYLNDFDGETLIQSYNFKISTEDESVEIYTQSSAEDKFGDNFNININKISENFDKTPVSYIVMDNLGNINISSNLDKSPKSIRLNENGIEVRSDIINLLGDKEININGKVNIKNDVNFENGKFSSTNIQIGTPGSPSQLAMIISGFLTIKINGQDYKIPLVK